MKKYGDRVSLMNRKSIFKDVWMMVNEPKILKAWIREARSYMKDGEFQPSYPEHTVGSVKWWILRLGGYV